ncbi:hypothetical protein IFM89_022203 [Coptis chinensis]|uniref:FBD domain-containing protein n=1 Tax=Coptis chinensis TaxID=261450 RepID=A0A835HVJ4_9MAGN|nr:hypothetical protein IFM89_022203 [Coptis chinensis]
MTSERVQVTDRFSFLPEGIRDHIQSFLPMEDVVKTSILSRQWRHICYSLSDLKFSLEEFKNTEGKRRNAVDFKNFVDRLLISHDTSDIRSFKLIISESLDGRDAVLDNIQIYAWVLFALKHNVRELKLFFDSEVLPLCIFTCHTLTVLHLQWVNLHFPSMVFFPSLKTLELSHVYLYGENLTKNLFLSFPVLECLILECCEWFNFNTSTSSPPDLKVLKLREIDLEGSNSSNIHISSPNLEEMRYIAPNPPNVSSETLSSLVRVDFMLIEKPSVPGNIVTKTLMGLCNVVKLSLCANSFEVLGEDPNLAACLPTSCRSLRHLCLRMGPFKDSVKVLILLLRSYPRLETLDISFQEFQMDYKLESILVSSKQSGELFNAYILKHLTRNLLKHLKAVKIKRFRVADEDEYHIVRYILENADFLKKMSILYHPSVEEDVKFRMLVTESLLTFKKVSPDAVIVFS